LEQNIFGIRLRETRISKGLTQQALAKLVGAKGKSTVANWESGLSFPAVQDLIVLASALGDISTDYLLGLSDDPARR
jgi:transcriptional regulator with XRE-family HTH domain